MRCSRGHKKACKVACGRLHWRPSEVSPLGLSTKALLAGVACPDAHPLSGVSLLDCLTDSGQWQKKGTSEQETAKLLAGCEPHTNGGMPPSPLGMNRRNFVLACCLQSTDGHPTRVVRVMQPCPSDSCSRPCSWLGSTWAASPVLQREGGVGRSLSPALAREGRPPRQLPEPPVQLEFLGQGGGPIAVMHGGAGADALEQRLQATRDSLCRRSDEHGWDNND